MTYVNQIPQESKSIGTYLLLEFSTVLWAQNSTSAAPGKEAHALAILSVWTWAPGDGRTETARRTVLSVEKMQQERSGNQRPSLLALRFFPGPNLNFPSSMPVSTRIPNPICARLISTLLTLRRVNCPLLTLNQQKPEVNAVSSQITTGKRNHSEYWQHRRKRTAEWVNVQSDALMIRNYTLEVWEVKNTSHGCARSVSVLPVLYI